VTPSVTSTLRKALRQLEEDRGRIDRQIGALRAVLDDSGPAGSLPSRATPTRPKSTRRPMSVAARRAVSRRMKVYWEQRKAAPAKAKA
jgi:hypothetical protein